MFRQAASEVRVTPQLGGTFHLREAHSRRPDLAQLSLASEPGNLNSRARKGFAQATSLTTPGPGCSMLICCSHLLSRCSAREPGKSLEGVRVRRIRPLIFDRLRQLIGDVQEELQELDELLGLVRVPVKIVGGVGA